MDINTNININKWFKALVLYVCLTSEVIYQTNVTDEKGNETYIGITEDKFTNRYRNHAATFRGKNKWNATELTEISQSLYYHSLNILENCSPY